jgi:hypothetical protein
VQKGVIRSVELGFRPEIGYTEVGLLAEPQRNQGDDQAGCALESSSGRPNAGGYRPKFNSKSLGTP